MKYLVAFGCSHTNGSMLNGNVSSSVENTQNAFGGILAKRHGYKFYNVSKPGGSNAYIHRSVVEYITHYMDKSAEHLFLINWTSRPRAEFRYPEAGAEIHNTCGDFLDKKSVPFTIGSNPNLFKDTRYGQLQKIAPYFINEELDACRWATWAYGLQCMLEHLNIPYLMSNTCESLPILDQNKKLTNKLNSRKYLKPFDNNACMLNYLSSLGYQKTKCWHFREDGHLAWADRLDIEIKELGYV